MAFYPDELSPIDRVRSIAMSADLPDINFMKNRRQWKSLVLGKKEMGMTNFATITEEKEEEISSEGSQGAGSNKESINFLPGNSGVATNKKITFPKPRKYITSRVSNRKEIVDIKPTDNVSSVTPLVWNPLKDSESKKFELPNTFTPSKSSLVDVKNLLKTKPFRDIETAGLSTDVTENFALTSTPIETQWNEAITEKWQSVALPKSSFEKMPPAKVDSTQNLKIKLEEKPKPAVKSKSAISDTSRRETKTIKNQTTVPVRARQLQRPPDEHPSTSVAGRVSTSKERDNSERGKKLNMKDVVKVYKNLAYGSKDEIKSFVEKLSFVKEDYEEDKNLRSVMNLKALENKIKNFSKKSSSSEEGISKEKKVKARKKTAKIRKNHIDRLARHKVVKVPSASKSSSVKRNSDPQNTERASEKKGKDPTIKNREPWKYVGMQSVLDKTYFVNPSCPTPFKKEVKKPKVGERSTENQDPVTPRIEKKEKERVTATKPVIISKPGSKVKDTAVVIRESLLNKANPAEKVRTEVIRSTNALTVSGSMSNKSMNRPSATTVCTVEFRPPCGPKTPKIPLVEVPEPTDPSLLVYLHGTKAINVKSPYSDKQFSRVKVFRKDGRELPLVKGFNQKVLPKNKKNISMGNVNLRKNLVRFRELDLLDFDEDIQNITEFLRRQNSPRQKRQEEKKTLKKSERESYLKEAPNEKDPRHQRRQRRSNHTLLRYQPQQATISPESIMNEIYRQIAHFQYLPDTEENRKMIAEFFDELDQRIEASRNEPLTYQKIPTIPYNFRPIPILGY